MFPIRDENPHFLTPWVTLALIALNGLSWALVQGLGFDPALGNSVCTLGLLPGELLGTRPPGTSFPISPEATCVLTGDPAWSTLLTHMFLHGSWLHLIGNMWFLWLFGGNVEDSMGHARFAVFYLLSGFAAAAAQILADPASSIPMVGASGAIGGVMGAYILLYPKVRVTMLVWFVLFVTTFDIPAFWMLGYWFLVQVIGGIGSLGAQGGGVAFWAHVGGFVAGAVLIFLFRDPVLVARHPHHGWR